MSVNFNAGSATTYSNSTLVFGGNDGAVKFPTDIEILSHIIRVCYYGIL